MASDQTIEMLFSPVSWNSLVEIISDERIARSGFKRGSVVALTHVTDERMAKTFDVPVGSRLLDIEGPDGSTVTVPYEDVRLIEA